MNAVIARLRHADLAAAYARHWQPGWPRDLPAALRHPVAAPLIRIGARRIARTRQQREEGPTCARTT